MARAVGSSHGGAPRRARLRRRSAALARPALELYLLGLVGAAAACAGTDTVELTPGAANAGVAGSGTASRCAVGQRRAALSVVDRSVIGEPAAYPSDPGLEQRFSTLAASQRARRETAWQIARRVLAPSALPAALGALDQPRLPAWQTWHAKDDLTRIFRHLYPELTPEERELRATFSPSTLAQALVWNDTAISEYPDWTEQRLAAYGAAIDGASALAGLGGIYRVAYAPGASLQLLGSYAEVLGCRESPPGEAPLDPADEGCGLPPSPPPQCLSAAFPASASIVKASWRRAGIGTPLPVYDTSAEALERRLSPEGQLSWEQPDGEADPGPEEIYTLRLPNGNLFRLAALHIMTKELDHWFWTTLWWSPEPDTDFGADRPEHSNSPWDHYKLCSVVAFDEGDPDPSGGFADDVPSLGASLAATHGGEGGRTWCSNPYLEEGDGNAASNCIGCHQHAGTGLRSEDILADQGRFPDHGRRLVRSAFPSDYVFAVSVGDDLGAMYRETEDHYRTP